MENTDSPYHRNYTRISVLYDDESSSNETIDNQPGTGRTLDLVYQYFGRKLERIAGAVAHRFGYGPLATVQRIKMLLLTWYYELSHSRGDPSSKVRIPKSVMRVFKDNEDPNYPHYWNSACQVFGLIEKTFQSLQGGAAARAFRNHPTFGLWQTVRNHIWRECRMLISYTQSPSITTSVQALTQIINLTTSIPGICNIFDELSTLQILQRGVCSNHEDLLTSSRRALYSIEDNIVNCNGKELIKMCLSFSVIRTKWQRRNFCSLSFCYAHSHLANAPTCPSLEMDKLSKQISDQVEKIVRDIQSMNTFLAFRYLSVAMGYADPRHLQYSAVENCILNALQKLQVEEVSGRRNFEDNDFINLVHHFMQFEFGDAFCMGRNQIPIQTCEVKQLTGIGIPISSHFETTHALISWNTPDPGTLFRVNEHFYARGTDEGSFLFGFTKDLPKCYLDELNENYRKLLEEVPKYLESIIKSLCIEENEEHPLAMDGDEVDNFNPFADMYGICPKDCPAC